MPIVSQLDHAPLHEQHAFAGGFNSPLDLIKSNLFRESLGFLHQFALVLLQRLVFKLERGQFRPAGRGIFVDLQGRSPPCLLQHTIGVIREHQAVPPRKFLKSTQLSKLFGNKPVQHGHFSINGELASV